MRLWLVPSPGPEPRASVARPIPGPEASCFCGSSRPLAQSPYASMARPIPGPGAASTALADPSPGPMEPPRPQRHAPLLRARPHWLIPSPGLERPRPQRHAPPLRARQHWLIQSPGRGLNDTPRFLRARPHRLITSPGLEPTNPQRIVPLLRARPHWLIQSPGLEAPRPQRNVPRLRVRPHCLIQSPGLEAPRPQRIVMLLRALQHWLIPSPGLERDGDYADPHTSEESPRIMTRRRGRRARRQPAPHWLSLLLASPTSSEREEALHAPRSAPSVPVLQSILLEDASPSNNSSQEVASPSPPPSPEDNSRP